MTEKLLIISETELAEMFRSQLDELKQLIDSKLSNPSEWLSSTEVPSYLGISRRCWQNYRDNGLVPFSQIGRKIWVKRSDIDSFLENCRIESGHAMSNLRKRRA